MQPSAFGFGGPAGQAQSDAVAVDAVCVPGFPERVGGVRGDRAAFIGDVDRDRVRGCVPNGDGPPMPWWWWLSSSTAMIWVTAAADRYPLGAGRWMWIRSGRPCPANGPNPAGDIPDNQAFVDFSPLSGGYAVKIPEGWARTDGAAGTVFTDRNTITVRAAPVAAAPTVAWAQAVEPAADEAAPEESQYLRAIIGSDAAALAVTGLDAGALTGWALSRMLVTVLTGVFDPPPTALAVPWPYLAVLATATLLALAVTTAAAVRATSTPNLRVLQEL